MHFHLNNGNNYINLSKDYGLANNVPFSDILDSGFQLVYDYPYSHITTYNEIIELRNLCNNSTVMCVGGGSQTDGILTVVACADCLSITTQTALGQTVLVGSAYWYFTPGYSFGFAPNSLIEQTLADDYDENSMLRLSWNLDELNGGWRLGIFINLNIDTLFKYIFLKNWGNLNT